MVWQLLTILSLIAAIGLHLWWRKRLEQSRQETTQTLQSLQAKHRQASLQLQTQQEALFDSMAEGLLLLDEGGRIQHANRAFNKLFGLNTEIKSRTIMEALRFHELAELVEALGTQKQVLGHELKISRPNELWLQVNGAAVFDAAGARHGTILVFHDQTRLKQLERTRQEFVANVSHELRTPLSLIKGYVETLLDGAKDNPEIAAKFLQTIERNTDRLKLLIEDLLTISELESGRVQLNLQTVCLRESVDKVLADFRSRAEDKQIQMQDNIPELTVHADADRLEQVLCNLVDNAIKYGRSEGKITISAKQNGADQAEISVQDDGQGIPPESLERVFERFYRVDKARSREQGGTGLGLSIVKHIVQGHGGKVWAKSELGHGATFYFTLPLQQNDGGES